MSSPGVPDGVKPSLPLPRRSDDDVARLLAALSGTPSPAETVDEWKAIAAFRAAKDAALTAPARARSPRRKTMISALASAKVLAAVTVATAAVGSTAAAAYTGNLPTPIQNVAAAAIGAPDTGEAPATAEPAETEAPETDAPEVEAPEAQTPGVPQTQTPAVPAVTPTPSPVGPDAKGPAAFGLCNAWSHGGLGSTSIAFRNLATAAGGKDGIATYCATVAHPGGKPTAKPTHVAHPTGKPTAKPAHVAHPTGKPTAKPTHVAHPTGKPAHHPGGRPAS